MSKKKTKRSRPIAATKLNRVPVDADGNGLLFDQTTGQPTIPAATLTTAERARINARERERLRVSRENADARRAAHRARLARRPIEMQARSYTLPAEVAEFLRRLHSNPLLHTAKEPVCFEEAYTLVEQAYREGCRQGFIEGFLYGEEKARPGALKNRERLRQQNLDKLARLGIADRNAEIVAEFHRLASDMPGAEERYEYLADSEKTGRNDWPTTTRMISEIVRKAGTRRR